MSAGGEGRKCDHKEVMPLLYVCVLQKPFFTVPTILGDFLHNNICGGEVFEPGSADDEGRIGEIYCTFLV